MTWDRHRVDSSCISGCMYACRRCDAERRLPGRGSTNHPNGTKPIKTTSEAWSRSARRICHRTQPLTAALAAWMGRGDWAFGVDMRGLAAGTCWELPRAACARNSTAEERYPRSENSVLPAAPSAVLRIEPADVARLATDTRRVQRTRRRCARVRARACSLVRARNDAAGGFARGRGAPRLHSHACIDHRRLGVEYNQVLTRIEDTALCARGHSDYG
jgi:hypothetical protein